MKLNGNGQSTVATWMGSLCTIFVLIVLAVYSYQKVDVMLEKKDVDILSVVYDSYFGNEQVFDFQSGFNIAVAPEAKLDPAVGEIVFMRYDWGYDSAGKFFNNPVRLASRPCTRAELGLEIGATAKFMPIHQQSKLSLESYADNFMCVDDSSQLKLSGEYSSDYGSLIRASLNACTDKPFCKNSEEIKESLKGMYLLLLAN